MKLLSAIIALTLAMSSSAVQSQEMLVLTEGFKPFQYLDENGRPAGFMVELVTAVFARAGVEMENREVKIYPWARAYDTLLKTDNAAVFMTVRNEKRENLFKWVGPLAPWEMWLNKLRSRDDIQAKTVDEARAYRVGGYRSAQTDYLIELGFPNVEIAPHERMNVERLLKGRVDMVPSLELMMAERLKDLGASYDAVEKMVLFDARFDYYLAVNPQTPDDVVERLQAALDETEADGTYATMRTRYIN